MAKKVACFDEIITKFANINKNKLRSNSCDNETLSSLIDVSLTQSEKIQLGFRMENMISMFILNNTHLKNIKEKNRKGKKETDHLFMDTEKKIVFYTELKSNLNLDTEKLDATIRKCLAIRDTLTKRYDGYEVRMFLVSLRHLSAFTIRNDIKSKYKNIGGRLVGINEYLSELGIPQQNELSCENSYKAMLNKFVGMLKHHS